MPVSFSTDISLRSSRNSSARSSVFMNVRLVAKNRASSSGEAGRGDGVRRFIVNEVRGREKWDLGRGVLVWGRAPERANSCGEIRARSAERSVKVSVTLEIVED